MAPRLGSGGLRRAFGHPCVLLQKLSAGSWGRAWHLLSSHLESLRALAPSLKPQLPGIEFAVCLLLARTLFFFPQGAEVCHVSYLSFFEGLASTLMAQTCPTSG